MQSAHFCNVVLIYSFVMDQTADFYSRPSQEYRGGGFPIFSGSRRQRGGGIFGSLKSIFMPVVKNLGRRLISQGIGLAGDVAKDALLFRNVGNSLKQNARRRAINLGKDVAVDSLNRVSNMIGKGSRRAPRRPGRKVTRKRKGKSKARSVSRKPISRKRRKRSKSAPKRKAKKRRIATNF